MTRPLESIAGMLLLLLLTGCAGERDGEEECPYLYGEPCSDHGIPDTGDAAFCDPCGKSWTCTHTSNGRKPEWYLLHTGHDCSCIVDGYNECGTLPSD